MGTSRLGDMISAVTVAEVPEIDPADELFEYGLADTVYVAAIAALDSLPLDHPARFAWDGLEDEIRAEVGPQIASLVTEAFRRRLPWTWEPEA
jgi:hypothetical protein